MKSAPSRLWNAPDSGSLPVATPESLSLLRGSLCWWDFQEPAGSPRVSRSRFGYELIEAAGPVEAVEVAGAPFGPGAARFQPGSYLHIPRAACPALDFRGSLQPFTIVAWVQRHRKPEIQCEAIAGMWDETRRKRQYALFLDLRIHRAADNVCGHVSATGGATAGHRWCMESSISSGWVQYFQWHCVAFSYDGNSVRSWLDGHSAMNGPMNPFVHDRGIYAAGADGADFTVGAVHRLGEMGNWFTGLLGGLVVFDRALEPSEQASLANLCPGIPAEAHLGTPDAAFRFS